MRIVKRDVYVKEFKEMKLIQKLFYVAANNYRPDWDKLKPNYNPLYWCVMDLLKVVRIFTLFAFLYPFISPFVIIYEAINIDDKYNKNKRGKLSDPFFSKAYHLEMD